MTATAKVRNSHTHPGLTVEITPTEYGFYLVFRTPGAMDAYKVAAGQTMWADCSDKGQMTRKVHAHCHDFAKALAAKLVA